MKTLWNFGYSQIALRRLWSDCADAQSDQSLCWAHMQCCRKYCATGLHKKEVHEAVCWHSNYWTLCAADENLKHFLSTVNPRYTDTRYNDKIRDNYILNVTKPSLKRSQLMRNYALTLHSNFKQHMFWIFVRIASLLCEDIRIKQGIFHISFCPLRFFTRANSL